jgi:hypothetical protein
MLKSANINVRRFVGLNRVLRAIEVYSKTAHIKFVNTRNCFALHKAWYSAFIGAE